MAVNIGAEILNNIPGLISTEVDARLSLILKPALPKRVNSLRFMGGRRQA